ncbi:threonine ammonia-lyase [Portibacter lacus]|uniref:L-threonine dehydratase n=1 Tax=Portibacter lacus TaxID=1099794 RepID=A0AA37SNS9_9BACT|nr:threonine ammonia-lyase [Portibacter lacus]GLR18121.1 threonine dehydratase [Portibacter lacus]
MNKVSHIIPFAAFDTAASKLKEVVLHTPLMRNMTLSDEYQSNIFLKREDLQSVRSYKIRGAYHKMISIPPEQAQKGVVCASAGNHSQGVALACRILGIHGVVYMPNTTPQQKIKKVKQFGKEFITIRLTGDTFDDAFHEASKFSKENEKSFIHPFDDLRTIEGQGTVGVEILDDFKEPIDYLFLAVGGGGLAAGIGSYFKQLSPQTKIIGVEPIGAPAMYESLKKGEVVILDKIDPFVDGAAVKKVGDLNFKICQEVLDDMVLVNEGKVCSTILQMYNEEAIVVEPAGALSISVLDQFKTEIKGKNIVCIVSGGNNDITRTEEIRERSLLFEGLKHYFIVRFPQRAGALREFLEVLGPNDDIAYFEYTKKTSRTSGPAIVGIELKRKEDYPALIQRMDAAGIQYETVNDKPDLLGMLV